MMWPWERIEARLKQYIDGLQGAISAQAAENNKINRLVGMVEAQEIVIRDLQRRLDALESPKIATNRRAAKAKRQRKPLGETATNA